MSDSIEKLAIMVAELMNEIRLLHVQMALLRKGVLDCKDICRGCAGYQDDFK